MVIDVGLQDLTQSENGGPVLSEPGSTSQSCAKWITVPQGRITLAPGQNEVIRASISIPRNVSGSYHAALTIKLTGADAPRTTGAVAELVTQTILPIHIFMSGTLKPSVELQTAELKPAEGNIMAMESEDDVRGKWVLMPHVKNTGNSMVRLRGDVIVSSSKGALVGRYQISNGDPDGQAILPGAIIQFPIRINSTLPDEQYLGRLNLRFQGARRIEGYSAPMTLKPRADGASDKGLVALGTVERTGLQALVEPRVVIGSVLPNSVRTQRITVTNLEDFPVSVSATASGLAIDVDGEPIALPELATAWMAIAPSTFRLGAQQSRVVSVRMNAPADQGDRWGLLQFAMSSTNPARSTLTTTARTSVLLRSATGEANGTAKVEKIALTRSSSGPIVSVTVANLNSRPLAFASSALQLTTAIPQIPDESAGTLTLAGETNVVLLPNGSRRLDFQLPLNIKPAAYEGQLKLNGLAATTGAKATNDFAIAFKLNLTAPVKTPAPVPAPVKPKTAPRALPKTPAATR